MGLRAFLNVTSESVHQGCNDGMLILNRKVQRDTIQGITKGDIRYVCLLSFHDVAWMSCIAVGHHPLTFTQEISEAWWYQAYLGDGL